MGKPTRRNPAGYCIRKLKGDRRKPYEATVLVGYVFDEKNLKSKRIYDRVGTYATRKEALAAISDYHRGMRSDGDDYTFREVYEGWADKHFKTVEQGTVSQYKSAFKKFEPLHEKVFASLKTADYEAVINKDYVARTVRAHCLSLLKQMYEYAIKLEIVDKSYNNLVDFDIDTKVRIQRNVIKTEDRLSLLKQINNPDVLLILTCLYTGARENEIMKLRTTDLYLGEHYFISGSKTESGKNRVIPIHNDIYEAFKDHAMNRVLFCALTGDEDYLFVNSHGHKYTDNTYPKLFRKYLPNNNPYETRHTFVTIAKEQGINDYAIKRIIGHKISDITESVYTHPSIEYLVEQMNKINFKI